MRQILTATNNKISGIHYTTNHTGKMQGLQSLSTSCLVNPICIKRMKDGDSICAHCFSASQQRRYKNMLPVLAENYRRLNERLLTPDEIPVITVRYFRFEAFGDVGTGIQAANYILIAAANPDTQFALFTKNLKIVEDGIKLLKGLRAANLNIIYSSPLLNTPAKHIADRYNFIDSIFTVYDKTAAANVDINCGARSCATCGRCYRRREHGNGVEYINELLK